MDMVQSENDKAARLAQVAQQIKIDKVCPELAAGATQLVPGEGNADAEIVFIGEAPGAVEDRQGRPFVGAAGKLLDELLASIHLVRPDVFITNVVKYRPPGNRDPRAVEVEAFLPYLKRQIAIIKPGLIVLLGRHAMSVFLPGLSISRAHGQAKRYAGQVYLPLFHPAAALYNAQLRQVLFDDFAKIPLVLKQL